MSRGVHQALLITVERGDPRSTNDALFQALDIIHAKRLRTKAGNQWLANTPYRARDVRQLLDRCVQGNDQIKIGRRALQAYAESAEGLGPSVDRGERETVLVLRPRRCDLALSRSASCSGGTVGRSAKLT
jgi:hypothetical protein